MIKQVTSYPETIGVLSARNKQWNTKSLMSSSDPPAPSWPDWPKAAESAAAVALLHTTQPLLSLLAFLNSSLTKQSRNVTMIDVNGIVEDE